MQDIHPIGGGGGVGSGRFYGGGGDRRLRPNNHLINHLALKCPRCDSANTKFCYYNNYNLSQPRHFCKSCRRYWTKGGVLRNVPVGGGCRKSKRSKPKATPPNIEDVTVEPKSDSHSSSESSSLTATTTAAAANTSGSAAAAASEAVSANSANTASTFINFSESNFFLPNSTNPSYDHHHHQPLIDHSAEGHIFQDIGSFQNLMSSSNDQEFNMAEILTPLLENQNTNKQWNQMETDMKMEQMGGAGCFNQAGRVDQLTGLQQSRVNNSELASLDWQTGSGEHGMYDLTGTVDQAYWSQTQWGENDQSLNFLP